MADKNVTEAPAGAVTAGAAEVAKKQQEADNDPSAARLITLAQVVRRHSNALHRHAVAMRRIADVRDETAAAADAGSAEDAVRKRKQKLLSQIEEALTVLLTEGQRLQEPL